MVCQTSDAFAETIAALLDDATRRADLSANAQAFVNDGYGWGAKVETLVQIIEAARTAAPARVA